MSPSVILLFGGTSSERRVSVASAQNMAAYLHAPDLWFIGSDGQVWICSKEALAAHADPFGVDFEPGSLPRWPNLPAALRQQPIGPVFFLALHGGDGENGAVQAQLETAGHRFTASGAAASRLAFDKAASKRQLAQQGVAVAAAVQVGPTHPDQLTELLQQRLGDRGPLILKPVADGSSVGLISLRSALGIDAAVRQIIAARVDYLVEDFLTGVELTVGVLAAADGTLTPLPATEVRLDPGRSFDFAGKYLGQGIRELTPAEVPTELSARAQQVACLAHRALGCYGYSRTDMIAAAGSVTFLELNTLPGLTRASFVPQQLAAAGRRLGDFAAAQVELALNR
jgi:D-alanine-D-alanine ligase